MTDDRAQYDGDGDHLDEVVIHNATVHLEAMDSHNWMVMVTRLAADGSQEVYAHFNARDITETGEMTGVPYEIRDVLPTCAEWKDGNGVRHLCFGSRHKNGSHKRHRCECGSTKQVAA